MSKNIEALIFVGYPVAFNPKQNFFDKVKWIISDFFELNNILKTNEN